MQSFQDYRFIKEEIEQVITEGKTFDELKKKIKNWIDSATEKQIEMLNDIWTRMNRDKLETPIESVVNKKGLPPADSEDIFRIISDVNTDVEDKEELTNIIKNEDQLIDPSDITNSKGKVSFSEVISNNLSNNETFQLSKKKIMQLANTGNEARGKGETFLSLFVGGVGNASKGDLALGDQKLEVKSSTKSSTATLRLREGVNAPNNVNAKEKLINAFRFLNPRAKIDEKSSYSFVSSEIKKWNQNLEGVEREEVISMLKGESKSLQFKGLRELYPKMSDSIMDRYMKFMVDSSGNLIDSTARYALAAMFFDYYKKIEGFDKMVIINTENESFIVIENGGDIINNANNIKINNTSVWIGKEERHASPEIGLV